MFGLAAGTAIKAARKFLSKWRGPIIRIALCLLTMLLIYLTVKNVHRSIYSQGYADGIKAAETSVQKAFSSASEIVKSISEGYAAENSEAIKDLIESEKNQTQALKDLQDETQTYLATPSAHDCALDADGVRLINKTLATSDRRPD